MTVELFPNDIKFDVIFNDKIVNIEKLEMGKNIMYLARFTDQPPLVVGRAKDANQVSFWTSIPEGRQLLAEAIGELITQHILKSW